MITVTAEHDGQVTRYTADRATHDVDSDSDMDLVLLLVGEALDTDGPIGPQVDEFVGAWGSWDTELNVVAAFIDAVEQTGGQVVSWESDDPPDPVTI